MDCASFSGSVVGETSYTTQIQVTATLISKPSYLRTVCCNVKDRSKVVSVLNVFVWIFVNSHRLTLTSARWRASVSMVMEDWMKGVKQFQAQIEEAKTLKVSLRYHHAVPERR